MTSTIAPFSPRAPDPCQVAAIKSKDFNGTPAAKQLSLNFTSFDAIVRALGITKPSLIRYCEILIAESKGRTTFVCSDLTVGARYKWGEVWRDLTEPERVNATKQGRRLYEGLARVTRDLAIRTTKPTGSEIELPLLNFILRVSEISRLGYSTTEAVNLVLDEVPTQPANSKKKEHPSSAAKKAKTYFNKCVMVDRELARKLLDELNSSFSLRDQGTADDLLNPLSDPPVLIHEYLKRHTPKYHEMGFKSYTLLFKDDESLATSNVGYADLNQAIKEAKDRQRSLILSHSAANIIQLDDCDAATVFELQPHCFEIVETSPGNFHCRLALPIGTGEKSRSSVRDRLIKQLNRKGLGCNGGGGKSFRVPGSINFKHGNEIKRDFWREHFTSFQELSLAGLLPYEHKQKSPTPAKTTRKLPDYNKVPMAKDKSNSARDFNWSRQALSWGVPKEIVMATLPAVSPTAGSKDNGYVRQLVKKAISQSSRWKSAWSAEDEDAFWKGYSGPRF